MPLENVSYKDTRVPSYHMKIKVITVEKNGSALNCKWDDDFAKIIPSKILRDECPCAPCQSDRTTKMNPLVLPTFKEVPVTKYQLHDVAPIGNYALALRWNDGHATGIYPYTLLRKMAEGL